MMNTHRHPIDPVFSFDSRILILGSFPSVKSREVGFYYGHQNNRFWKVISTIVKEDMPITVDDKKELLLRNHIALWDVIAECDIIGSSDSSIKNVVANDISLILRSSSVKSIFTNGNTAGKLYKKYLQELCGIEAVHLPSTSPANAACSLDKLIEDWKVIAEFI